MKYCCVLAFTVAVSTGEQPDYAALWSDWQECNGMAFNDVEDKQRFQNFKQNVDIVNEVNAKGFPYKLGLNKFAHLSKEEYATTYLGFKARKNPWQGVPNLGVHQERDRDAPDAVDWVEKGAVTPIKDQGQCGGCWAFSATGAFEGAWQIANGDLVSLSEQQLMDCSKSLGNNGCQGGNPELAFMYYEKNDACTEDSYPYLATDGTCSPKCTVGIPTGSLKGFKEVKDESALLSAVAQQPISVAIEADQSAFQLYESGVFTADCGTELDHAVLLVGYGTDSGSSYWKLKNSWGSDWGESGYIRFERDVNKCGIAGMASYPVTIGAVISEIVANIAHAAKKAAKDEV